MASLDWQHGSHDGGGLATSLPEMRKSGGSVGGVESWQAGWLEPSPRVTPRLVCSSLLAHMPGPSVGAFDQRIGLTAFGQSISRVGAALLINACCSV
jgi:hypothetical protein